MKLELIINKETPEEYLTDMGILKDRVDKYGLKSFHVEAHKHYMCAKYEIDRHQIKANWINYQLYLYNGKN